MTVETIAVLCALVALASIVALCLVLWIGDRRERERRAQAIAQASQVLAQANKDLAARPRVRAVSSLPTLKGTTT